MSSDRLERIRLVDGDGAPRPGHSFPGRVRLKPEAVGSCPYPLEAGRWYPADGFLPSLDGRRRQWLVELDPGEELVPIDEHLLELGPDDPEAFQRSANSSREDGVRGPPSPTV